MGKERSKIRGFWQRFNENVFKIFAFLALALLVITIGLKGFHYLSDSRFASKKTILFPSGYAIRIVYPTVLKVVPSDESARQIAISIEGYLPNKHLRAVIDFSESQGLIFHDLDGNVVSSILIIDTSKSQNNVGIFVSPEPLVDDSETAAVLNVNIRISQGGQIIFTTTKPYNIKVENPEGSKLGYWLDSTLSDIGIPLGFAIAILGWAIDYRYRRKEEISKERLSLIQSLRELSKTDIAEAMQRLIELEKEANYQRWTGSLKTELDSLRSTFEAPDHIEEMLRETGEALRQNNLLKSGKFFLAVREFCPDNAKSSIDAIIPFIRGSSIPTTITVADCFAALDSALDLWSKYDEHARQIIVRTIFRIKKALQERNENLELLKERLVVTPNRSRLLGDPAIKDILPEYAFQIYKWPEVRFQSAPAQDFNASKWINLEKNLLKQHPFVLQSVDDHLSIFLPPQDWDEIKSIQSLIISSEIGDDLEVLKNYLYLDIQKNKHDVFPVVLSIRSDKIDLSLQNIVQEIARATADAWMELISKNPSAFLDLTKTNQLLLGEFLTWRTGLLSVLQFRLKQRGLLETAAGRIRLYRK